MEQVLPLPIIELFEPARILPLKWGEIVGNEPMQQVGDIVPTGNPNIIQGPRVIGGSLEGGGNKIDISVLTGAINSSGNFINDVINARLDTSSKKILSDFNFGTVDYAGAVKSGDITWNATTGAITGGSGVVVYRKGIVGATAGVVTFSIDATTGAATFAGTLSAASGTFGTITAGTIDGCDVYANNFRYKRWTVNYHLGSIDGWESTIAAGGSITCYSTNLVNLVEPTGADEITYMEVGSFGVDLGTSSTSPIDYDKSPTIEWTARVALEGDGVAYLRVGTCSTEAGNSPRAGFVFYLSGGNHVVKANYSDGSAAYASSALQISGSNVNSTFWHKYRILITPNGANYDLKFYIDDTLVQSYLNTAITSFPGKNFGAKVDNNYIVAGAPHSAQLLIGSAIFQQDY